MMSSERVQSSNDKLLKKLERLENNNMELNTAKIKDGIELECYKKKVDELDLRVNQLERAIQVLMSKQLEVENDEKKATRVSNPCKSSNIHLPMDLIVQILSRLPVKSLLRFTTICKTWKSLIDSTYFISKHLEQYPRSPNLTCSSLIVGTNWREDADKEFDDIDTCFHFENLLHNPVNFEFLDHGQRNYSVVVGVCDGLICVGLSNKECAFVVWNPATRHLNQMPPCQQWNIDLDEESRCFGFGLHPSANDYKLVIITSTNMLSGVYQVQIYSMSSDDWQVFELSMRFERHFVPALNVALVVANGVFYWDAKKSHSDEWVLVSFNVNDEVLQLVDTPQSCERDSTYDIIQWKEEVALISVDSDKERSFDVWLLNAVTGRWSKQFKVQLRSEIDFGYIYFIGCTKNGDLLFEDHKKDNTELYSYDTMGQEINKLLGGHEFYYSYCYVESLLPVKKKNETLTEKLWCWRN